MATSLLLVVPVVRKKLLHALRYNIISTLLPKTYLDSRGKRVGDRRVSLVATTRMISFAIACVHRVTICHLSCERQANCLPVIAAAPSVPAKFPTSIDNRRPVAVFWYAELSDDCWISRRAFGWIEVEKCAVLDCDTSAFAPRVPVDAYQSIHIIAVQSEQRCEMTIIVTQPHAQASLISVYDTPGGL